jgi:phosphatidylglycerophosphate synthase
MNFYKLRKNIYKHQSNFNLKIGIDINNFKNSPHAYLKTIFNIEIASVLTYISLKMQTKPNDLTTAYAALGAIGGILLATPNNELFNLIAIIIFFSKSVLDVSDGSLARASNQTSDFGSVFDAWAGRFGYTCFIVGLGLHLFNKNNEFYFLILIIIILITNGTNFKLINLQLCNLAIFKKARNITINKNFKNDKKNKYKFAIEKFKILVRSTFDDRSRSTDLICFLIFVNFNKDILIILNLIFYFIALKSILAFIYSLHITKNLYK